MDVMLCDVIFGGELMIVLGDDRAGGCKGG